MQDLPTDPSNVKFFSKNPPPVHKPEPEEVVAEIAIPAGPPEIPNQPPESYVPNVPQNFVENPEEGQFTPRTDFDRIDEVDESDTTVNPKNDPQEVYTPAIQPVVAEPKSSERESEKPPEIKQITSSKEKVDKFKKNFKKRKKKFVEQDYPRIYAWLYDAYNFEIVNNKAMDLTLKALIVLSALMLFVIILVILKEMIDLLI